MLFYRKLSIELEDFGFKINPYDPCAANKMVNGSQMTVTWHVDDLKISHKDKLEAAKFLQYFRNIYGDCMNVHRGKVHDYLGMDLDINTVNMLKVGMIKYIKKIHTDFPEDIKSVAAMLATEHLFDVREDNQDMLLTKEQARVFHPSTSQLLFLCVREQHDIRTPVLFIFIR